MENLVHAASAGYRSKEMIHDPDDAIHALPEIEAHPLAGGLLVYRLVTARGVLG